jgi:hypothetical protein
MGTTILRNFIRILTRWLCLMLPFMLNNANALTLDVKAVKLSAEQHASLKRYVTDSLPARTFDWTTLTASAMSERGRRQPLMVTLTTVPALSAAGVCQREEHYFHPEAAEGKRKGGWQSNVDLTRFQAWMPQGGDCSRVSDAIDVDRDLSDKDFLFIHRQRDALRSRAAGVIGGSDCARVRFCEVTLRRIRREIQESPSRPTRTLTKLTYSPLTPGPACLYVMEVSFVGPLHDLVPLGASCPVP